MLKRIAAVWLTLCMVLSLTGCYSDYETVVVMPNTATEQDAETVLETEPETEAELETEAETEPDTEAVTEPVTQADPPAQTYAPSEDEPLPPSVEKDGSYTTPEDVAEYIHTFGTLPENFITKKEAMALGWLSSEGNLWEVAPGKSIGGDFFGNREGLLPEGRYHECDVNYEGGFRGSERLIYGDDGSIWYTNDHYASFEQLY